MFAHKLSESITNRVEMTDIDGDTLAELLRYIYTGLVRLKDENSEELE